MAASPLAKQIGSRIRLRRLELDLTQEELAALAGVRSQNISNWERGIYELELENLIAVSDALRFTPDQLLGYQAQVGAA